MFGLFNNKKEASEPDWLPMLHESQARWFSFLDKLEEKMEELCLASIPELKEVLQTDDDIYKRTFNRVFSGVNGQLENIRKKASDTYDEKIIDVYDDINAEVSVLDASHDLLYDFRNKCAERHNAFEEKYDYWRNELAKTEEQDLEIEYQKVLADFAAIKNKFSCKQCGGNITIEKIFFIETYIACPQCQTQNTFEPSTQARMLQNFARGLAEQRTAHLYQAYQTEYDKERDLYHERHEISLSVIHEKDKKVLAEKQQLMADLEERRQAAIKNAPKLYEVYLRAMYDQWNLITPDLKEHNEKMFMNQLQSK